MISFRQSRGVLSTPIIPTYKRISSAVNLPNHPALVPVVPTDSLPMMTRVAKCYSRTAIIRRMSPRFARLNVVRREQASCRVWPRALIAFNDRTMPC